MIKREQWQEIADWYLSDLDASMETIGQHYGVSRERIRQIISQIEPEAQEIRAALAREKELLSLEAEFAAACQVALAEDRRCVVCDSWVLRSGNAYLTCSTECAEAWVLIRDVYEVDGGRHRERCAKAILNNPKLYKESLVEWAQAVKDGSAPTRRFVVEGSKRSEALKKFRPEIYEKIVQGQRS